MAMKDIFCNFADADRDVPLTCMAPRMHRSATHKWFSVSTKPTKTDTTANNNDKNNDI